MKKDFVEIQATYDFILDQFENGDHLDDVSRTVNDNLEDFLAIGCEPAKLASMMNPVDVLTRIELFKDIDINPVAKRLDGIDFEVFFKQLVELGVKADSIRDFVSGWDGETIIEHSAKLLKCGFSKEELSDLLYEKNNECYSDFSNVVYLDLVSASKHLYTFMDSQHLDEVDDCEFWTTIKALLDHGADKEIITEWIADRMTHYIFDANFQKELRKYDIFPSEDQILDALNLFDNEELVCDLMWPCWPCSEDPNPLFMTFMNDAENPHELISKLDDVSCHGITEYCEYYGYGVIEEEVLKYPNFWKNVAILFLENHNKEMYDELDGVLKILSYLQIDEPEWRKVLSGHKEWLEEFIREFKNDSSYYSVEIELLNKLLIFAS